MALPPIISNSPVDEKLMSRKMTRIEKASMSAVKRRSANILRSFFCPSGAITEDSAITLWRADGLTMLLLNIYFPQG